MLLSPVVIAALGDLPLPLFIVWTRVVGLVVTLLERVFAVVESAHGVRFFLIKNEHLP